jgi:hypothetical protein
MLTGLACIGILVSSPGTGACQTETGTKALAHHVKSIACREAGTDISFSPLGIAFGLMGELYVIDSDNSLVFALPDSLEGMTLFSDCPSDLEDCRFMDMGIGLAGDLFVSERTSGTLLVYDRLGGLVAELDAGDGLTGIGVGFGGRVYAAMGLAGTVRIVDVTGDGEAVECVVSDDSGAYPVDCLVTKTGRLLVTEPNSGQVLVFGPLGQPKGALQGFAFERPFGLARCRDRLILVSDSDLGVVAVFSPDGRLQGTLGDGILKFPTFLDCRDDGTVCVADAEAMTIEVFKLDAQATE